MIINRQNSQCNNGGAVTNQGRRSLGHSKSGLSNGQATSSRQLQQRSRDPNQSKHSLNLSLIKPHDDVMMTMHAKQMCSSTTSANAVNSSALAKFKQAEPRYIDINMSQGAINTDASGPSNLNLNVSVNQASGMMKRMRSSGNPNSSNMMTANTVCLN